ncbi:MAG: hypothetical protein PHU51_04345 [Candidatus Nanoarchaeia archaeon]|nr:hypothetical protein [Candidatus Nanoarchaeia archaeon]
MNKKILIWASSILVAILLFSFFFFSSKSIADFHVVAKGGEVSVLQNGEWIVLTQSEQFFKNIDAIKTTEGEAILTIKQATIITVDPNSEIKIDDLTDDSLKISQVQGSSWNKFLALTGIKSYDVQTTHTVASVRGTGFYVKPGSEFDTFMLGEGELALEGWNDTLKPFQKVIVYENQTYELQNLTEEEIQFLKLRISEDLDKIKKIRETIFDANKNTISTIKKLTSTTDEDFTNLIEDIDEGRVDDKQKMEESPIPLPNDVEKIVQINEKIKEQKSLISILSQNE